MAAFAVSKKRIRVVKNNPITVSPTLVGQTLTKFRTLVLALESYGLSRTDILAHVREALNEK